ncbi:energy transducer TonB [Granulicella sp. S190]|uniref:energy transducer TonB family protein n=1 Tax=Granulicella sp. S190 TaxID=1747226 RepID=UPI00131D29CB|nr:TonB family protein [Granulicella sp. S190]
MPSSRPASPTSASSPSRSRSKESDIDTSLTFSRNHQDKIGSNLFGSFVLHGLVAAILFGWAFFFNRGHNWGESASNAGAIQATMVSSLPLPPTQRTLDTGVLTSEAPSPAPVITKERTEPPPAPNEVAIPEKITKPIKTAEKAAPTPPKYIQPVTPPPTKAVTGETAGIRIAQSTLEVKNGTASVSVEDRTFGERFAYYVNIVNSKVAQNWYTAEADPRASIGKSTTIIFDINREGVPSNARVETPSGSPSLDTSAIRAVQRVDGFGPLPQGDHITVEYTFHLHPQ